MSNFFFSSSPPPTQKTFLSPSLPPSSLQGCQTGLGEAYEPGRRTWQHCLFYLYFLQLHLLLLHLHGLDHSPLLLPGGLFQIISHLKSREISQSCHSCKVLPPPPPHLAVDRVVNLVPRDGPDHLLRLPVALNRLKKKEKK